MIKDALNMVEQAGSRDQGGPGDEATRGDALQSKGYKVMDAEKSRILVDELVLDIDGFDAALRLLKDLGELEFNRATGVWEPAGTAAGFCMLTVVPKLAKVATYVQGLRDAASKVFQSSAAYHANKRPFEARELVLTQQRFVVTARELKGIPAPVAPEVPEYVPTPEPPPTPEPVVYDGITCRRCGLPINEVRQPELPHVPRLLTAPGQTIYSNYEYHRACAIEETNSTDLQGNPNINLQFSLRAGDILGILSHLETVIPAKTADLTALPRLRRALTSALAEHAHLYVICSREECQRVVSRRVAVRGTKTMEAEHPGWSDSSVSKKRRFTEERTLYMFCSEKCDEVFAVKAKALREAREAEKREKAKPSMDMLVKLLLDKARAAGRETEARDELKKQSGITDEEIDKILKRLK